MARRGQPTKLTPEVIEDVKRILPTVMYMETVGDYLGVERTTWRKWLKRGRKEYNRVAKAKTKTEPLETESLYLEFFHCVKKCLAEGEIFDAGTIKKASAEQWQAAAWRLERRFPERWGRRDHVSHAGRDGGAIPVAVSIDWDKLATPPALPDPVEERIRAAAPGTNGTNGAAHA